MHAHAGGAELVVGDYLHDFCRVQLGHPTSVVEGEVVVFEAFDGCRVGKGLRGLEGLAWESSGKDDEKNWSEVHI